MGDIDLSTCQACKRCEEGFDLNPERGCRWLNPTTTTTDWKGLKSKIGHIVAKASAMRVSLNLSPAVPSWQSL